MTEVKFNYPPNVALKAISDITEQTKTKPEFTQEERFIYEDILTLAKVGLSVLMKHPTTPVPGETTNKN